MQSTIQACVLHGLAHHMKLCCFLFSSLKIVINVITYQRIVNRCALVVYQNCELKSPMIMASQRHGMHFQVFKSPLSSELYDLVQF
jgi:hypothetical protein